MLQASSLRLQVSEKILSPVTGNLCLTPCDVSRFTGFALCPLRCALWYLFPPRETLLKPPRQACESVTDDKIDYCDKKKNLGRIYNGAVIDLRRYVRQLRNPDDKGERRVFDHGNKLVYKGWDHVAQSLGEYNVRHYLPVVETGG